MSRRATQKDVARKAGVTQATVSLALAHHPRVSLETRAHVEAVAEELGYRPDPYLSGLSYYRNQVAAAKFKATLAWLSNWHLASTWRWPGVAKGYFEGATRRATELGYLLEEYPLRSKGMTATRMEQILYTRNVQGILLPPQPEPGLSMDFCFNRFSVVTFGYTLTSPQLNTVALHHYRSMEMAFRKLLSRGYKRPGLMLSETEDERTDHIWSAAFWSEQRALPVRQRVPPLVEQTPEPARFIRWFKRYRPDVVIASPRQTGQWLAEAGYVVPGDVGLILLTLREGDSVHTGVWQNLQMTGAKAVDFVIDMIHRGERGVPPVRSSLLIDASWTEGTTVRPAS